MSINTITEEYVISTVWNEWKRAVDLFLSRGYEAHTQLEKCSLKKMACFGQANSRTKEIIISSAYIGSQMFDDLLDTIRHEICHFLVGNKEGHNSFWKFACTVVGCTPKASGRPERDKTFIHNAYKYELIAVNIDGKETVIGHKNKKTKKFLEYTPESVCYRKAGIVSYFYYKDLKTGETFRSQRPKNFKTNPYGNKYDLFAIDVNGNKIFLGKRKRKTSKLAKAKPYQYRIGNTYVERFVFEEVA